MLLAMLFPIFGIAGQSNATGQGNIALAPKVPAGHAYSCNADTSNGNVALVALKDPMQQIYTQAMPNYGSLWPAFANEYWQRTGTPVVLCGGAIDGMGLVNGSQPWIGDPRNMDALFGKIASAQTSIANQGNTSTLAGILWCGGEHDAQSAMTSADWTAAFASFVSDARARANDPNLPVYIISLDTAPGWAAGYARIRQAQIDAAATIAGVFLVVPYQNWSSIGWHVPNNEPHWSQPALNIVGALAAAEVTRMQTLPPGQ
jgi:hypothetical protein